MKLPSLQHLAAEAARVGRRFPLTLLCSLLLCAVSIYYEWIGQDWLFPLLSATVLGLTLTLNVALAGERYHWPRWGRVLAAASAASLLVLWYALVPSEPNLIWVLRLAVLLLALHLLVAVVPYLPELRRTADTSGFWHYNEILLLRILTAGLYSGVLFAGCALALAAVENLFDVAIEEYHYLLLLKILATVFNTWFFLAGVPHNFRDLEQKATYPKGLKLFTQFVLLPLVILYLVILYAYLARILVSWTLPRGWVSTLVLAFSTAGIFALLLIHPIRHAAENTWIRTFARWFYRALFPLLGLLFVAIGTRIQAYGLTEERYFVLVLTVWLAGIAAYFLLRQGRGIIWIPASLAVVALLSSAGPWGAFAVAERSQLQQLRELAVVYNLLENGKLDGAGKRMTNQLAIDETLRTRVTSVLDFFATRNAVHQLQPFFTASVALPDSMRDRPDPRYWASRHLHEIIGMPHYDPYKYSSEEDEMTTKFVTPSASYQALGGGRYWLKKIEFLQYFNSIIAEESLVEVPAREGIFRLRTDKQGYDIVLEQLRADSTWQRALRISPGAVADSLVQVHGSNVKSVELPAGGLELRASSPKASLTLFITELIKERRQDSARYYVVTEDMLELKK